MIATEKMKQGNIRPSKTFKAAMRKADKYFSQYIRLRDAISPELCKCVTCDAVGHWKMMDCGHFMIRSKYATRFDEKNCNVQCTYCNKFQSGRQAEHGIYIDERYGVGTAKSLIEKSKGYANFTKLGLDEIAAEYKLKIDCLKAKK